MLFEKCTYVHLCIRDMLRVAQESRQNNNCKNIVLVKIFKNLYINLDLHGKNLILCVYCLVSILLRIFI